MLMHPQLATGIVGYGAYVPRYRLPSSEVNRVWHDGLDAPPITEKSVPGPDEDTVTMSIEAARNALARAGIPPASLGAVWVGSESHPYAVKPTSSIVAEAIGAVPHALGADWQFACKAGTEALQAAIALVGSGMAQHAMAIGMDTAQGRPGDALEYTAAAGGAAYILGGAQECIAVLEGSTSWISDTPDFWRRPGEHYPEHAGRFTGDPAYFRHVLAAAQQLLQGLGVTPRDVDHAVFHQPNLRFPLRASRELGFSRQQLEAGLLVDRVGNAYAGSSMLGLSAVLDVAEPGQRILQVSFGSGAGSDALLWRVTERLAQRRNLAPSTAQYIGRRVVVDYAQYARYRGKLA
ncbi:MAG: hydroxymethylglutaryl-CoA synthase [Anaerolineae bacterium]|jgi:hydroxymethylglutaryl-CoA synthase|nr:hydroxymethylglutaryl-CoA synthase [Chloroflexota bacterium]